MDELDRKLLEALRDEGRISFRELAHQFDVSSQTISDRIVKMMEKKIIKGFTVMVDQAEIGYPITFVVELDVDLTKMEEDQEELSAYQELYQIHVVTGDHDILALGVAKDITHLYEIVEKRISNIAGIKATKTLLSLKIVKEVPKVMV